VVQVEPRDYQPIVVATGTLVAERYAVLRALVDGDIAQLPVDIGDEVRTGQLLFQIRQVDYQLALQRAQAAVAEAEAAVEDADRERLRLENLLRDGAATEQMRDKAVTVFRLAAAVAERLRAARDTAEQQLRDTTVVAPYPAAVTALYHEQGEYAKKGEAILEITDLDLLNAEMDLPERLVGAISRGMKVPLTFEADVPDMESTVVAVNPKVDRSSRTFRVKAAVANRDRQLSAGMFCTAILTLPAQSDLPAVPAGAVIRDEGQSMVWIVEGDSTHRRRIDEVGDTDGWIVTRAGVQPGEWVVVSGSGGLVDGSSVVVAGD
jgi:RND family efflux transporter MFP subunit